MDDPSCLPQPAQGKHQEREFRQCNRCPVCPPHLVRRPRGAQKTSLQTDQGQPQPLHGLKLVIKEEVLPMQDQPEFSALALLASRGLLAPDAWKCKRAQVSLKATIDVPMLGTIIEQNGNGLLEDSHVPVGWPLHIDGAVRQCCIHRSATLQELDDMLEYDMKRDSVEINHNAPNGLTTQCGTENTWNRRQDTHCGNFGLIPSRPLGRNLPLLMKSKMVTFAVQ